MSGEKVSGVDKFGEDPLMQTSGGDVWSVGGAYTYLTGPTTLYISSSNAADVVPIVAQGLGINGEKIQVSANLNGQNQVALPGLFTVMCFRAWNASPDTDLQGDVYIAEDVGVNITNGVPDDITKIKAKIPIADLDQQTQMAIYAVPAGKGEWLKSYYFGIMPKNVTAAWGRFGIFVKNPGGIFRNKFKGGLVTSGNNISERKLSKYLFLPPGSIITARCFDVSANDLDVFAGFITEEAI